MSVEKFIDELQERNWLPDRVMAKLRATVANSHRPVSARSLAKFLVEKRHLSQQQAKEVLGASAGGAVIASEASPAVPEGVDDLATADTVRIQRAVEANQFRQIDASQMRDEDEDYEGSSIFAPFLDKPPETPEVEDEELTLAPVEEDLIEAEPDLPRDEGVQSFVEPPVEEIELPKEPPRRRRRPEPEVKPANFDEIGQVAPADNEKAKKKLKKKPKRGKKQNRWDSPLMLLGGGGLALMLLAGGTVWWLMNWESGDQQLTTARAAMESGAYGQAIEHYEKFLESSPRHPERSAARVQLAMVRIRQPTEAGNFPAALALAETELKEIEDEEDFDEAHAELAALLPQIALGLAKKAEEAGPGAAEADQFAEQANMALALSNNVTYVLKSLRNEAKLTEVRETLERTAQRQETHRALQDTLAGMQQAVDAGTTRKAYVAHAKLLREYPQLASDAGLSEVVQKTTSAEQSAIKFVKEEQSAETKERPTPWIAALAVANRQGGGSSPASGAKSAVCVRVDGAVYGFDTAKGHLLWRRHIGFGAGWPIRLDRDVLVTDEVRHELLRLDAATGRLIWRQPIAESFTQPVVVGERVFVAAESGRLYLIDLKSGARTGFVQFAQPLSVSPAVDREQNRMYVVGEQACLYTISLSDLSCQGVRHLGHAEGSIKVPPIYVADKVAVLENDGVETSRLRLLSLDDEGSLAAQVVERRLSGLGATQLVATGRRLIIVTDRGQLEVYDVAAGDGENSLNVVATRAAQGKQPVARHITAIERNIWVGDTQLTKYTVLPTGNRLPSEEIENNFAGATFDHPLQVFGDMLVHVHRPKGRAGAMVVATNIGQGRPLWQTHVATPPAGPPVVNQSAKAITVANVEGNIFRFDEAAIRSRVQDHPIASEPRVAELVALSSTVDLGNGLAVFCGPELDQLLLYHEAHGKPSAQWIKLESPLAAPVTPLGDGIIAPLKIGQVFYLNAVDGSQWGTPFQPRLEPRTTANYAAAAVVDETARQFLITDGREKIYLVAAIDQPQPHLEALAEADVGAHPIESSLVVLGDVALAIGSKSHVVRFRLPSLEPAGESSLPAPVVWGPFRVGDAALVRTADEQLLLLSADGKITWSVPLEHGDLAGEPLTVDNTVLLAYRKGILERRALGDGKLLAAMDVEHPLAAGPVRFLKRIVLSAHDGTMLVVDQP